MPLRSRAWLAGDTLAMREGPVVVPAGHAFMLGDNRDSSEDSRAYGAVPLYSIRQRPARVYFSRDPATGAIRWERAGRAIGVP